MPDGALMAQRDAPVGGQAVLEGVMMRGVSTWAVAVRRPPTPGAPDGAEGGIDVQSFPLVSWTKRHRLLRLPVIRGIVALGESLSLGFKALGISANAQVPEDEEPISGGTWAGTVAVAVIFAVGLFFLLPVGITSLFKDALPDAIVFVVIEKLIRVSIFLGYLLLLSRMKDLRRVFEYHGAEHKVIATYEAGDELDPGARAPLLAPAPALRNELPAVRDDRRRVRVRSARTTGLVHPVSVPRAGDPDRRGARFRDHQVGRPQPAQALGALDHVARPAAPEADHARP